MAITISGPDGASIDFPDGTPEHEISAAMAQAYPHPGEAPKDPGFLSNAVRAVTSGANPFQDRMVAAEKTLLPQSMGGSPGFDYGANLEAERAANQRLREQHPNLSNLGQGTGAALSSLAVPAAALGRYAQGTGTLGRVALGGAAGEGVGAIQGLGAAPDFTNPAQTAESTLEGANMGGALGAAFPAAASGIGKVVNPLAEALKRGPGKADIANLGREVSSAYKNVEDLGAAYSPEAYQRLVSKIAADAEAARINPGLHPGASGVILDMQKAAAAGNPIDLPRLDQDRQIAWRDAAGKPDAGERQFGGMIRKNIDEFVSGAKPEDMATPGVRPAPAEDIPFDMPALPSGPAPTPLLTFLQRGGGLRDEGGDLASMGFSNLRGVAGQGSNKLIDKTSGRAMDEGLQAAVQAGYIEPHETVADFINKIGDHPTYSVHDQEAVAMRNARDAAADAADRGAPHEFDPGASDMFPGDTSFDMGARADPREAANAIGNARDLAMRQFKANALAKALDKAEVRAAVSGSGGNIENTTRQRMAAIMEKEPWSKDELAQINKMVLGGPISNTFRELSKLSPFGHAVPLFADLVGAGLGHVAVPGLSSAVGMGAQAGGALMRRNARNSLLATILAGGQSPRVASAPLDTSRAMLAATLAANRQLSQNKQNSPP